MVGGHETKVISMNHTRKHCSLLNIQKAVAFYFLFYLGKQGRSEYNMRQSENCTLIVTQYGNALIRGS